MKFEDLRIDDFNDHVTEVVSEMQEVLEFKRRSYGPHNLTRFGLTGIVIRASDKIERLATMTQAGTTENVDGDSMEDAIQDLIGYGILALLYYRLNVKTDE
jgi:hypothetical protein